MPESPVFAVWRVNRIFPVLIVALLAINGMVYAIIDLRMAPDLNALNHRLIDNQARSRAKHTGGERANNLEVLFRKGEDDLAQFRTAIPDKETFTTFLGELFSLAADAGLSIDGVSYSPEEKTEFALLHYTLSFTVQGNYEHLKRFIHSIEQSPRPMIIEGISLSNSGSGHKGGVSLALRLITFFRSDKP